jgi:hypothetical protein
LILERDDFGGTDLKMKEKLGWPKEDMISYKMR